MLADHPDVSIGAVLGMIEGHKATKTQGIVLDSDWSEVRPISVAGHAPFLDREALQLLEGKLKDEKRTGGDKSNYHGGLLLFLMGKYDKAKEFIEKAVKTSPTNAMVKATNFCQKRSKKNSYFLVLMFERME